jgi:hypothetical protein
MRPVAALGPRANRTWYEASAPSCSGVVVLLASTGIGASTRAATTCSQASSWSIAF